MKCVEAKPQCLALALRIPHLEGFLPVARKRRRNLRAPDRIYGRCERIAVKEIYKSKACGEFRDRLSGAQHRGTVCGDERVPHWQYLLQPGDRIGTIVISVPAWIVVVRPEDSLVQRFLHDSFQALVLLLIVR